MQYLLVFYLERERVGALSVLHDESPPRLTAIVALLSNHRETRKTCNRRKEKKRGMAWHGIAWHRESERGRDETHRDRGENEKNKINKEVV